MKFNKKLKKGFTLVELIVVIAIVAILAAVSVVSYIAFINSANESADIQLVKQLNVALQADETLNGPRDTMHEMLGAMEENGFVVENLTKTKSGYDIVWDQEHNRFGLLNGEDLVYGESTYNSAKAWNIWKFADTEEEAKNKSYSVYLTEEFAKTGITELDIKAGLDVGEYQNLEEVSYTDESKQEVIIRTNGSNLSLTVNAPSDDVKHYGKASEINITAIKESSYHEYGKILGNITISQGHLSMEEGSSAGGIVVDLSVVSNDSTKKLSVDTNNVNNVPVIVNSDDAENLENVNLNTGNNIVVNTGVTGVAAIGNTGYETLQGAIDAAAEGSTIVLLSDVVLSNGEFISVIKTITLNMNGYKITGNRDGLIIIGASEATYSNINKAFVATLTNSGNLIIKGNGEVINNNWDAFVIFPNAVLSIYDGSYTSQCCTISAYNSAVVNTFGGTFISTGTGTSALIEVKENSTANFYAGNFVTSANNGHYGILLMNAAELNLGVRGEAGPSMNTWRPCIATNGSMSHAVVINIYSGTYKANRNNTTIDDQNVIQLANATNETQTLNIYGGYFEQTSHLENSCIFTVRYSGSININISGGTFVFGNNSKLFCGYGTNASGYPSSSNVRVNVQNDIIPNNVTIEVYGSGVVHIPEKDFVVNP